MRKTLNINLGGLAFIIDENAYELLHVYLESLKTKFKNEAGRDEILNDIEARIAEMLNQKLASRREVVGIEDVQYVTGIMGKPEDIAGEETQTSPADNASQPENTLTGELVRRRLFRDPDDEKVAGVISGLCHYFGINDPTWVRLMVVLLCFVSFGTVVLVYILLAIVIPKAQTSAEKLQMKGEPVNISTIEKEIKGAVSRAGESVNRLVREQTFFEKFWGVSLTIITGLVKFIAGIIILAGFLVLVVLIAGLLGISFAGNNLFTHAPHLFIENSSALTFLKFGVALFIGAPVVAVIYAAMRLIFGKRTSAPMLKWILIAVWWIGVFMMSYGGFVIAKDFGTKATKNEEIALVQPPNGTLFIQLTDTLGNKISKDEDDDDYNFNINQNGITINGVDIDELDRITIGEPALQLMPSLNDSFYIQKSIGTRGKNKGDALTNSGYVIYDISQHDTILSLPAYLELDKNGKYRFQDMKIRIAIPEGKFVSFADNLDRWAATVKGDNTYDDTYFANTTWTVKDGKVMCVKGENHFNAEEKIEKEVEEVIEKHEKKIEEAEKKIEEAEKKIDEAGKKLEKKIIKIKKEEEEPQ